MNRLITLCVIGIITSVIYETVFIVRYFKAKNMIKNAINNCFKALEGNEAKYANGADYSPVCIQELMKGD